MSTRPLSALLLVVLVPFAACTGAGALPNSPPSVSFDSPWQVTALLPMSIHAWVSDPDGDPLTYTWSVLTRPAGSAAILSDSAATFPNFTPDVAGSYTIQLAVSDGLATTTASGTFSAIDYPPVASAGIDRSVSIGATVTLDASASSDANQTPLAFAWALRGPTGSAAALTGADTAMPTFLPDVPGFYRATVTVTSGGQAGTASVNVTAWPAVERFTHRILDAAYSDALDRIVMVAADPDALYLLDPATGIETQVALTLAPSALALSPDGRSAAVGHARAVTSVNLSAGTAEPPVAVSFDVADLVLGSGRVAWAVPRVLSVNERAHLVAVSLDGAPEVSIATGFLGATKVQLRPGTAELYLAGWGASGYSATVEHYSLSGVTPVLASSVGRNLSFCGDLWFSQAGTRLFTSCGPVYLASSSLSEDLTSAGTLSNSGIYGLVARHLSDSTAAGQLSAITTGGDIYSTGSDAALRRWSATGLTQLEVTIFPSELVGTTSYRWGGRFVFYRSDGSARYVLLQFDPASGVLQDFGWVTY
jgi:chitinase